MQRSSRVTVRRHPECGVYDAATIHAILDEGFLRCKEQVESAMDVETDMDRATLAAYFTPQLERAGWTRGDAGEDGALTWSTWAVVDPAGAPWRGVLHVLRCPDRARRYRLSLAAEWPLRHV